MRQRRLLEKGLNVTDPTAADFAGLAAKLDGLDLSDAEEAILFGVLWQATQADAEVAGFADQAPTALMFISRPTVDKLGGALGFNIGMPPTIKDGTSKT
jgi:hypothetical protein